MIDKFYIGIAGLTVEMNARHELARDFCRDYIIETPQNIDIIAETDEESVKKETELAEENVSEAYAEVLCLYRSIAAQLPKFGCFVFHGAAISYKGNGYLFTAPSGTGKSTHIRLWRECIGKDVDIINGDKPILKKNGNEILVCSTPWAGKENWQKNRILPLGAICLLNRGEANTISHENPSGYVTYLMNQIYIPRTSDALMRTMEFMDKMLSIVPFYSLRCNISADAVKTSFEAMTGDKFPKQHSCK